MTNDTAPAQLAFPFDMTPRGPLVDAARERELDRIAREKAADESAVDFFDLYRPDF